MPDDPVHQPSEFEQASSEKSLIVEFWEFLGENRKFWMIPILVVFLLIGGLLVAGKTYPLIYALF